MTEELRRVWVKWKDSAGTVGWRDVDDDFPLSTVESVGFLWTRDKEQLVLVQSVQVGEEDEVLTVCSTLSIPAEAIMEMEDIG